MNPAKQLILGILLLSAGPWANFPKVIACNISEVLDPCACQSNLILCISLESLEGRDAIELSLQLLHYSSVTVTVSL